MRRLLFIHHSCGAQLLADPGPEVARASGILVAHPNGGGLRAKLRARGYETHEASYGSEIGDATDLFDWKPKFSKKMAKVLTVDENDRYFEGGETHDIVMFKSCFPNNRFAAEGVAPGMPAGPELTVENAKAALSSLLEDFAQRPQTLFVYLTAPPEASPRSGPLLKVVAKRLLGRSRSAAVAHEQGRLARAFNAWVVSPRGWLAHGAPPNVAAFDYFDVLTDHGASDLSRYPSGDGGDSHPSSAGNTKAADALVEFLERERAMRGSAHREQVDAHG
ncbi:MAG: putative exported protein [Labilithrix sp.]|nr:putative exported protein [Labilithrix sp.]